MRDCFRPSASTIRQRKATDNMSETKVEPSILQESGDGKTAEACREITASMNEANVTDDDDVYLKERVLPFIHKGIVALAKVAGDIQGDGPTRDDAVYSSGFKNRFQPVIWLAQYLMRNNPNLGTDTVLPDSGSLLATERQTSGVATNLRQEDAASVPHTTRVSDLAEKLDASSMLRVSPH
eukprot:GHVQ01028179.1.p1 GENE.GHVQ01028179.1~~GHVQ01028179.1.p1  ORF type:complete len:181 (+),score=19.49 GHVQ01028179.1:169-711(+)